MTLHRTARGGRLQVVVDTATVSTTHPQAFSVTERFGLSDNGQVPAATVGLSLRLQAQRFCCCTNSPLRREVCGGDFEAELPRSAFGITVGLPFVADTVRLKIQVEANRQTH